MMSLIPNNWYIYVYSNLYQNNGQKERACETIAISLLDPQLAHNPTNDVMAVWATCFISFTLFTMSRLVMFFFVFFNFHWLADTNDEKCKRDKAAASYGSVKQNKVCCTFEAIICQLIMWLRHWFADCYRCH